MLSKNAIRFIIFWVLIIILVFIVSSTSVNGFNISNANYEVNKTTTSIQGENVSGGLYTADTLLTNYQPVELDIKDDTNIITSDVGYYGRVLVGISEVSEITSSGSKKVLPLNISITPNSYNGPSVISEFIVQITNNNPNEKDIVLEVTNDIITLENKNISISPESSLNMTIKLKPSDIFQKYEGNIIFYNEFNEPIKTIDIILTAEETMFFILIIGLLITIIIIMIIYYKLKKQKSKKINTKDI